VVSEFVRFDLFHAQALPYPGERVRRLDNVVRRLDIDEGTLWHDFKPKVRKNISAARRRGVRIEPDSRGDRFDDFFRVYQHTMSRRGAGNGSRLARDYFERLQRNLPGQFMYFHALHQDRVVSTELVLVSEHNVYSFLGGTDSGSFALRPNELLKYEIMLWAKAVGKTHFVLGGGYRDNDGIFLYKRALAPKGVVPFFVGHRILRREPYDQLLETRRAQVKAEQGEWTPEPGYFPEYRARSAESQIAITG
jgi:lipid II:glycine glycyltransferase (peptidoglycan interpeptide bridge formation enzyme)